MLHDLCQLGREDALRRFLTEFSEDAEEKVHVLLSQKNDSKYLPLHVAIFERNAEALQILLEFGADCNAKCHGTPSLHLALRTAAQPASREAGLAMFRALLQEPSVDISAKDDNRLSVLHVAAFYNFSEAVQDILQHERGGDLVNLHSQATGLTALHLAALNDSAEAAALLVAHDASLDQQLALCGSTPLHCAAYAKSARVWKLLAPKTSDNVRNHFGQEAAQVLQEDGWTLSADKLTMQPPADDAHPTLLIHGEMCAKHHTCAPSDLRSNRAPPENAHRLHVLVDQTNGVLRSSPLAQLQWAAQTEKCALSDVLRVHEWSYVRKVQAACESLPADDDALAHLDGDTAVSRHTFDAALVAAGAVCTAVDRVVEGHNRNAFCAVRPPGHHAGPLGAVKGENGSESHGFCILNNVSIAAAYALNRHRHDIKRVAIVDFDVHHGNGTEETVRWLKPFCTEAEFSNENGFGKLYTPRYKPWFDSHDSENVLFVSVHGYGPREKGLEAIFPRAAFYPGSGATAVPDIVARPSAGAAASAVSADRPDASDAMEQAEDGSEQEELQKLLSADDDSESDESYAPSENSAMAAALPSHSSVQRLLSLYRGPEIREPDAYAPSLILDIGVPLSYANYSTPMGKLVEETKYRFQWRNYFREIIFPRLLKFSPDLILISAGFDAHKKDAINSGYIALIEEDYQWVTERLVDIANTCSEGRVVSVLEGGYELGGEYSSAFAKSIFAHVHALARGSTSRRHLDKRHLSLEATKENEVMATMERKRDEDLERRARAKQELEERMREKDIEKEQEKDTPAANEDSAEADTGVRKRRRAQVDYVALDQELRAKQ